MRGQYTLHLVLSSVSHTHTHTRHTHSNTLPCKNTNTRHSKIGFAWFDERTSLPRSLPVEAITHIEFVSCKDVLSVVAASRKSSRQQSMASCQHRKMGGGWVVESMRGRRVPRGKACAVARYTWHGIVAISRKFESALNMPKDSETKVLIYLWERISTKLHQSKKALLSITQYLVRF